MKYKFDPNELTSEKSLWEIHMLARRLKPSQTHMIILIVVTILLSINVLVLDVEPSELLQSTRRWAEYGFNFSITTLGFLIAGFTIFATLSKPEMMLAMMDHINPETKLPTLKYNFFAFMKVFIAYIAISVLYLSVILFGQKGGLVSNIINELPVKYAHCVQIAIIKTSYVYIGVSFVYLLLLLQTFIYNIYAIVMNSLRWEHHILTNKPSDNKEENNTK